MDVAAALHPGARPGLPEWTVFRPRSHAGSQRSSAADDRVAVTGDALNTWN